MQKLCFNISHSRHAIVLAVCANGALGVDIESLLTRHDVLLEVAQRHFSPPEVADLCALPVEKQADRFLHYWTLKEAYIKARGLGLSIPLDKFGFIIDESTHLDFWTEATLDEEPHRWLFRQIVIADSHVVAVCAARDSKVEQTLTATMCIPGVSERSLAMTQLRHSI
jgi:4'-phosphopantetheinyl transferase